MLAHVSGEREFQTLLAGVPSVANRILADSPDDTTTRTTRCAALEPSAASASLVEPRHNESGVAPLK
jgi:hypothetical protein